MPGMHPTRRGPMTSSDASRPRSGRHERPTGSSDGPRFRGRACPWMTSLGRSRRRRTRGLRAPQRMGSSVERLFGLDDRDEAAVAARAELGLAVPEREDRVVAADLGARAGAEPRAALADDDLARLHVLAGEDLDAEVFRVRVAAVLRRAEAFLVRHYFSPFAASACSSAVSAPLRLAFCSS